MTDRYGVMSLILEFWISIVVLIGGGFLMYSGKSTELAISAITAVITFWFSRRQAEQLIYKQQQAQDAQQTPPSAAQPEQPKTTQKLEP